MSMPGSSRPVPRPLQLPSNSSSPRSSPVIGKSPLSAPLRYNNTSDGNESPVTSPRIEPRRQTSLLYTSTSPNTQSPKQHVRRNTVGDNDSLSRHSPITKANSLRLRSLLQSVNEVEPVTLAEKHADLLRFIAQKESKCLELRTQLAQHEAELLVLKQKWERIVSKGSPVLPRASPAEPTPTTPSRSDVLGGIRDGVQNGFEKVLAVLEPAIVGSSSSSESSSSSSSGSPVSTTTSTPLPPKPKPSILKHNRNTESLSSTQGRSSISSSTSSLFDDTRSNGTQSLDSPIIAEEEYSAQKVRSLSSVISSTSNAQGQRASSANNRTPLSSAFSQLSSSLPSQDNIVPFGKSVANWVSPSLNKKWEELRNNETISKQSKRASLLFNDMLSALSTTTSTSSTPDSTSPPIKSPNCRSPISSLVLDPVVGAFIGTGISSTSLMDDDDTANQLGVALQPDHIATLSKAAPESTIIVSEGADDDQDKWNW